MYRKFSSFEELVNDFLSRDGIAVRYADEDNVIRDISYREFAKLILSEALHVKAECSSVEVIRDEQTPETLVNIFAHVMASCDILVADPLVPEVMPSSQGVSGT